MARSRNRQADAVTAALRAFLADQPEIDALRVAFSGGRDSTVLLHALARLDSGRGLTAMHVHHGLHEHAQAQAEHCRRFAARLGVDCEVRRIQVPGGSGEGLEAAARRLRYQSLAEGLSIGSCVLTAHHAGDQAETFLLAALKGSGPSGLAAMPPLRALGLGWLGRPLLGVGAAAIAAYAQAQDLKWVEDPSNRDTRFDRNYLRRRILPLLTQRFPVEPRLGAAAGLQAEAVEVLEGLLDPILDRLYGPVPWTLRMDAFLRQPPGRRSWLLRRFLERAGAPAPRRGPLLEFLRQLAEARPDSSPGLQWSGCSLRTYRGVLYLLRAGELAQPAPPGTLLDWPSGAPEMTLPDGRVLTTAELRAVGIHSGEGVRIGFRQGGEVLRTPGGRRSLKTLMQARGIPPWQRPRVPLVRLGDEWVAALWQHAERSPDRSACDHSPAAAVMPRRRGPVAAPADGRRESGSARAPSDSD
ncbi:tRNA(Ile)-lysidine synthetase [Thioalkalivibrio nitratireducens DSM 14787]|uniref:tRNA(Ile)-lysidine synthase n=1 Tax=Thioalkalivibrio nitratireducens (strain DSM 14787 / UNIQEM 213 / ALEN2) TaxID=1255043 RepID=L0DX18_THIND|nr:tRNA lysidine(34) synthetase TilS [Thioalkalivibrio nitratireducens]AGA33552.1 tRNA(Ile)-lysidine synthetase [Thioalkalivibrio nitratireducens DSM 14787]